MSESGSKSSRGHRVLVTGHNGYIGSIMVKVLASAGFDVVGLDTYFFEDCRLYSAGPEVPSVRKDIRDLTVNDVAGFDAIVHLAALCNDPLGDLNAEWTHEINHSASVRLAKLAKEAGVQRYVYASSCSMYGAAGDDLINEDAPLHPLTPYAVSKVRTEEDVSRLADADFSPVFMRNATAYGLSPCFRADVVLNNLVCWAYTTGKVRILSDGTPWRPIVHIEDISRAFAAVLRAPRETIHNQAFNVGSNDENYQVRQIAEIVRETLPGCVVEYAGKGGPDPRNYRVDFTKFARTITDFTPRWTARLAAKELYEAFQRVGLTAEIFQGRRCTRLVQLKHLIDSGILDGTLRWKEVKVETAQTHS